MSERYKSPTPGTIEQTAVLRDVQLPEVRGRGLKAQVALTTYSWLVVMNQECDLQQHRLAKAGKPLKDGGSPVNKDKLLRSILLCPAFPQEDVLSGTYTAGASAWKGTRKEILLNNREDRFHNLKAEGPIETDLTLDFKLLVATHPDYLEQWIEDNPSSIVAILVPPFRDRLVQRFLNYFGRIPEPDEA